MAQIIAYKCKQCNHKVQASPNGFDTTMTNTWFYFKCEECQEIVTLDIEEIVDQHGILTCPNCHNIATLSSWNPIEGHCPKCGGEMEQDPDGPFILAD